MLTYSNTMAHNSLEYFVQISESKKEEYSWGFTVPPRSQFKDSEALFANAYKVLDMKFKTGFLAHVDHRGKIELNSKRIQATLGLPNDDYMGKWSTTSCHIKFYSGNKVLKTLQVNVTDKQKYLRTDWNIEVVFGDDSWEYWNDSTDRIRLCFLVEQATRGDVIESSTMPPQNALCMEMKPEWNDLSEFFLSNKLSDIKFSCEGVVFPAHKLILSSRSSVFNRMLQSNSGMIEAKEGKIQITDMKSSILKEMLRFIYCGHVENLEEINQELIIAADKYDLGNLKAVCENSLIGQLNAENALAFCTQAESIHAEMLKEKSLDFIKMNKSTVFKTSEELMEFSNNYPEVVFQLIKM